MFSNSSLLTFYCRQNAKIRKSLIILYLFFKAVYPLSRYFEVIMLFLGAQYIKKACSCTSLHSFSTSTNVDSWSSSSSTTGDGRLYFFKGIWTEVINGEDGLPQFIHQSLHGLELEPWKFWGHKLAFFFITIISKRFSIDLSVCMNCCWATWSLRSFPCISNHCTVSQSLHQATWSWKWDPICKTVVW